MLLSLQDRPYLQYGHLKKTRVTCVDFIVFVIFRVYNNPPPEYPKAFLGYNSHSGKFLIVCVLLIILIYPTFINEGDLDDIYIFENVKATYSLQS